MFYGYNRKFRCNYGEAENGAFGVGFEGGFNACQSFYTQKRKGEGNTVFYFKCNLQGAGLPTR